MGFGKLGKGKKDMKEKFGIKKRKIDGEKIEEIRENQKIWKYGKKKKVK